MTDELNFDLAPVEIPVTISGTSYLLCEATEETAAVFTNASLRGVRMQGGKMTGLPTDLGGMQSLLVSRCLFPVNTEGEKGGPVSLETVQGWPSRVVKPLFERAKEISEIGEEENEESLRKQIADAREKLDALLGESPAKNGLDATPDGSG